MGSTVLINHTSNPSDDYKLVSATFTVPANGGYYLIAHTLQTSYVQQYMDEIRVVGDINLGPTVAFNITQKRLPNGSGSYHDHCRQCR